MFDGEISGLYALRKPDPFHGSWEGKYIIESVDRRGEEVPTKIGRQIAKKGGTRMPVKHGGITPREKRRRRRARENGGFAEEREDSQDQKPEGGGGYNLWIVEKKNREFAQL